MVSRLIFLLWLTVVLIPQSAKARLGDSPEECRERYGKPQVEEAELPAGLRYVYRHGGLKIAAEFMDGKVAAIFFRKTSGEAFEAEEIEVRLKENAAGKPWPEPHQVPAGEKTAPWWKRIDRSAQLMDAGHLLIFMTSDYANQRAEAFRSKQAAVHSPARR